MFKYLIYYPEDEERNLHKGKEMKHQISNYVIPRCSHYIIEQAVSLSTALVSGSQLGLMTAGPFIVEGTNTWHVDV